MPSTSARVRLVRECACDLVCPDVAKLRYRDASGERHRCGVPQRGHAEARHNGGARCAPRCGCADRRRDRLRQGDDRTDDHEQSLRCAKPFIDVNCAAFPEHLVESELFGYEKGAFSGAEATKPGLFELADQGTLFLDEVGELDARVQAKLLRVLDGAPYY